MDTKGLALLIIVLMILIAGAVLMNSGDPVQMAATRADAGIAFAAAAVSPAGSFTAFLLRALTVVGIVAVLAGLGWLAYSSLGHPQEHWRGEPRNRVGRWSRSQKLPSLTEMLAIDWMQSRMNPNRTSNLPSPNDRSELL
jgi:hypothetical protein